MAEEISSNVKFEGPEEVKMADWLEGVLKRYAATVISRKSRKKIEYSDGEVKAFPLHITSLRYSSRVHKEKDLSDWGEEASNHTISEIALTYCFSQDGIECPQHLLTKASRVFCNEIDGKDLDEQTRFRMQEIDFYTKVVPGLEDWAFMNDYQIQLPLPYCYFGRYECSKIEKTDQRTKDYFISIGIKYRGYDEDMKNLHPNGYSSTYDPTVGFVYEMNTLILLEQLTKFGYEKCSELHFNFEQVEAATKKIAKFHALSYAWEVTHKKTIKFKWPIFPKSKHFANFCSESIVQSFSVFFKLWKSSKNPPSEVAMQVLENFLEKRIPKKITKLLRPVQYPLPNGILHNNLCPENIFFSRKSSTFEYESVSLAASVESKIPNDPETLNSLNEPEINMNELKISDEGEDQSENEDAIKDCRFIGWNMCNFGPVLHDLAYLMITCLTNELRRSSTVSLLQIYYAAFRDVCDELDIDLPFDCQKLYDEFPKSLLYAALMATRTFNENSTKIDADYVNKYAEIFEEFRQNDYIN